MQFWPPVFHENKRCLDPHPDHTLTAGPGGAHPSGWPRTQDWPQPALSACRAQTSCFLLTNPGMTWGSELSVLGVGGRGRQESPDQAPPLLSSGNELHRVVGTQEPHRGCGAELDSRYFVVSVTGNRLAPGCVMTVLA